MADQDDDDTVGYKKPPRRTRFKKGQSGNPRGRKPRSRNASTILMQELNKTMELREGGRVRVVTRLEGLIAMMVNNAILGKTAPLTALLKILELEKAPDRFEASLEDEDLLKRFLQSGSQKDRDDEPDE